MTLYLRDNLNLRKGEKKKELQMVIDLLDVLDNETLAKKSSFTVDEIQKLREKHCSN